VPGCREGRLDSRYRLNGSSSRGPVRNAVSMWSVDSDSLLDHSDGRFSLGRDKRIARE
jgi:hypothetical protein